MFATISLPLMRPGLANAFLLGFVESMADFGNPLVLGGNFEVLSTKIFFAVVGAAHDQSRAAVLAIILLAFTLGAFCVQHAWLGKRVYTTVTGKGDSGIAARRCRGASPGSATATAIPWAVFTFVIYAIILVGGFVKAMGRDHTPTLEHYLTGFRIEMTPRGLFFSGSAWNSFFATIEIAAIAAPITAAIGLLTAYLLTRQSFAGRRAFEFATMLSFAIPGTVVGVSYILAFNVPPIEITGTGLRPRDLLRVPQHAGRRARRHRDAEPDRQEPGRGLADARRALRHDRAARDPAAAAAGDRRLAGLQLRARHDGGERGHLPRHRRIQHGDRPISSAASRPASSASRSPIRRC